MTWPMRWDHLDHLAERHGIAVKDIWAEMQGTRSVSCTTVQFKERATKAAEVVAIERRRRRMESITEHDPRLGSRPISVLAQLRQTADIIERANEQRREEKAMVLVGENEKSLWIRLAAAEEVERKKEMYRQRRLMPCPYKPPW